MSPILLSLIAFACVFGGTFLGMLLRKRLPGHHLSVVIQKMAVVSAGNGFDPARWHGSCARTADCLGQQHVW